MNLLINQNQQPTSGVQAWAHHRLGNRAAWLGIPGSLAGADSASLGLLFSSFNKSSVIYENIFALLHCPNLKAQMINSQFRYEMV